MTITRIRPFPDAAALAVWYAEPHNHHQYGRGHEERVDAMIRQAEAVAEAHDITSVADLSCGNAAVVNAVVNAVAKRQIIITAYLGDFAPGYPLYGPIEETIEQIPHVDLFVSGETIEHLDDPAAVLAAIRAKTSHLVLSTPVDNFGDTNGQHLWSWDSAGVDEMLDAAGFTVEHYEAVDTRLYGEAYCYGIWRCT